jgi:putative ABC transport system permease protein
LRAIGFGGLPTFVATITESLLLALIGGLLGSVLTFLAFDGLTTSTAAAGFANVVFSFKLSWFLVLQGLLLALAVGIVGGVFPALHAARTPILAVRAGGS